MTDVIVTQGVATTLPDPTELAASKAGDAALTSTPDKAAVCARAQLSSLLPRSAQAA